MNQPLVSVLVPCYNVEKYVEESLRSILNQTYTNLEIIAIDDYSKDNTVEILQKLAKEDNRIRIVKNEENLKLIKTLNKGISLCNGDYIARMDADDISFPNRIAEEISFLEKNRDYDFVSCQFYTFRTERPFKRSLHHNPTTDEELRAFLLFKSGICHPAVMIRKRVFTELGLKFEGEYLHVEDYALWSKAIYLTKLANINKPLLLYRIHQNQVSTIHEEVQMENKKKVFKIHCQHLGLPETDEYLDIYASVAEAVPRIASFEYIAKCEDLMLSLLDLNKDKQFCSHIYLSYMLSLHWLRLCANSRIGMKIIKQLKSSRLYIRKNYNVRDIMILYFKCLFKVRYKKSIIYKILFR